MMEISKVGKYEFSRKDNTVPVQGTHYSQETTVSNIGKINPESVCSMQPKIKK